MSNKLKITIQDYLDYENSSSKEITKYLHRQIDIFEHMFDAQQNLFFNHFATTGIYYDIKESEQIVSQCYHKSINLLYIAHKLTICGSYGAANSILRQVFEFLVYGKFYSLNKSETHVIEWNKKSAKTIYDIVISKLDKPEKNILFSFWRLLSEHTHASKSAYQLNTHFNIDYDGIYGTYSIILMLLRCNYHLLNSCYINKNVFGNYVLSLGLIRCNII